MTSNTELLLYGVASRTVDENGVIFYWDADVKLHNPVGPAVINPDRATYWLITGENPSEKAAWWFGYRSWWVHGRKHRTDGPAVEYGDGTVQYWVYNTQISEEQFHQRYPAANDLP